MEIMTKRGFPEGFVPVTTLEEPSINGHHRISEVPALDKLLWVIDRFKVGPFALRGEAYLTSGWKRGFDLAVASGSLLLLSPLMAGAMSLRKLENPHTLPLLAQPRNGISWSKFPMLKIRSQDQDTAGTGHIKPTKLGLFLRKTSIDEIPQLLNVLRGEMHIVGSRPTLDADLNWFYEWAQIHQPYEKAKRVLGFTDEEWKTGQVSPELRTCVEEFADMVRIQSVAVWEKWRFTNPGKPGITGLYQISGRRELSHDRRMKLDLVYRDHASLLLDLFILAKTPQTVLSQRGAR
ncbi:MAG: hypothetical protein A3A58_03215 [Candidatus Blackburnbacteria bacterium RIFCSPLOWO2_01_FULL_41_27]|uniref:Bacterial sugar transferase domain-containing protein n=1 Tax=Candidatus Blackburnbacteria bacterium RIFCSPLOWO2_01_FULL_41_27 TaxID=1797520 RepID=A0A1G1VCH4_9BACT|nr:MAG: hypothetical protein A3A58_03215 [Candidatus Blackburnbacteria bacterium RIFCSPLOWO2_01_FULL_41_27]